MERFAKLVLASLNSVLELPASAPISASELEIPPDPTLGDFAFPCYRLSKTMRKAPAQVAEQLAKEIIEKKKAPEEIDVYPTGPYVNFRVQAQKALGAILGDILKDKTADQLGAYGSCPANSGPTWVLEYSSPNMAKPFNIYHLRPTALGAALDRVGRYRGYKMISINHLGDWGTQFGKLAVAFELYARELPENPSVQDLVDIYVRFHQALEKDPILEDKAREAFKKLEDGDPSITALWKQCLGIALKEFNRLYDTLGVHFDHMWGESYYKDMLTPLLGELRQKGLLIESEGAWIVEVTDKNEKPITPCILQKRDGATLYATRDVAAAIYRYDQFHFDRMTYIVGGEQKLHFEQIFGVLKRMGFDWAARAEHVPTGLYRFKDAKMSTRKGNFVTLEEVLEQAKDRVRRLLKERADQADIKAQTTPSNPENPEQIAEAVGIGAVVFHDLHTDPARDVEFELDRVVNFEGETGPYLQYAYTRALSILRKAPQGLSFATFDPLATKRLNAQEEVTLVKMLGQFPLHLERTLKFAKASQLAHYLIDLTKAFGSFYRECRVLGEDQELTRSRLMLVEATRRVLGRGLKLLGIPLPERM